MIQRTLLVGGIIALTASSPALATKKKQSLPATATTIPYKSECIGLFAAMDNPSQRELDPHANYQDMKIEITLTPGCKGGFQGVEIPVWPEFSKHLRFEFSFSDATKSGTGPRQLLNSEMLEVENPAWAEDASFRKLEFVVKNVPAHSGGNLVITIFKSEIELAQAKIPLSISSPELNFDKKGRS